MSTLLSNKVLVEECLTILPKEILSNIISEGNTKSFVLLYSSNKFLNNICKNLKYDDKLWENLYRKLFIEQKFKFKERCDEYAYCIYYERQEKETISYYKKCKFLSRINSLIKIYRPRSLHTRPFETDLCCYSDYKFYIPSSINKVIFTLTKLENLVISNHGINNITYKISNLTNLKYLNLNKNLISFIPNSINQLKNLTNLDLSNNQLKSICAELCDLVNLVKLNLYKNDLDIINDDFNRLTNLQ